MNDFEKSADIVMETYRKTGALDGLNDDEIQAIRKREIRRIKGINKKFDEFLEKNPKKAEEWYKLHPEDKP